MSKPYYSEDCIEIYHGDCLDVLRTLPSNSVDTIITDPPYHLTANKRGGTGEASLNLNSPAGRSRVTTGFMGKAWDGGDVAFRPATWMEVMRVCKPGAMLLAFGGTRTYHRLACAIEDGGWELRDCISWLYGSGFPKSLDLSKSFDRIAGAEREVVGHSTAGASSVGFEAKDRGRIKPAGKLQPEFNLTAPATDLAKEWNGWGTALKPSWEPIILAMKPLEGTFAANAEKWGCAGLNIDGGRIAANGDKLGGGACGTTSSEGWDRPWKHNEEHRKRHIEKCAANTAKAESLGRFPANLILDEQAAELLDEQSGHLQSGQPCGVKTGGQGNAFGTYAGGIPVTGFGDSGGASRFFYTAKASRHERGDGNTHPTVKPLDLMEYLCKLTKTPKGGTVLDCFMGSGTTALAAMNTGRKFIGIEQSAEYCAMAVARIQGGRLFAAAGVS